MPQQVVATIDIAAPLEKVWLAVSSPEGYGRCSPEATGARRVSGHGDWAVGDRFVGTNRAKVLWRTSCRVVAAVVGREFAFESDLGPLPIARWSYELEDLGGVVRVTEHWVDRRRGVAAALAAPSGWVVGRGGDAALHNLRTMQETLRRMKAALEAG